MGTIENAREREIAQVFTDACAAEGIGVPVLSVLGTLMEGKRLTYPVNDGFRRAYQVIIDEKGVRLGWPADCLPSDEVKEKADRVNEQMARYFPEIQKMFEPVPTFWSRLFD